MPTHERWRAAWAGLGLAPPERLYEEIRRRYEEPHRAYHTLEHLAECFSHFDAARHLAERPAEVELALWFHDAVYDPRAADSEERSAAWAERALAGAGAAPEQAARVASLVLATKHAGGDAASPDHAVLLDTDLAILGAPPPRFLAYEAQIRREYAFVPEEAFRRARAALLARLLARPRLYTTGPFFTRFESQARANLKASLARLAG
jgi:predicted metal-dependent HD superfamily phosphohydrolase